MHLLTRQHALVFVFLSGAVGLAACGGGNDPADPGASSSSSGAPADGGGGPSRDAASSSSSSSGGESDAGDAAVTGVTISGQVVSQNSRVAGATVTIQGKTTTTAANGTWSLDHIEVPYQATVVLAPELAQESTAGARGVTVFTALTTPNPVLPVNAKVVLSSASLNGLLSGGVPFPNANTTNYRVRATAPLSNGGAGWQGNPGLATKDFDVTAKWPAGQTTQTVTLLALEFSPPTGLPASFSSVAGISLNIANGETKTTSMSLGAVQTTAVNGAAVIPDGYTQIRAGLVIAAADGSPAFDFDTDTSAPVAFSIPFSPALGETLITFTSTAPGNRYSYGTAVITSDIASATLHLLPAADLLTPAANAAGVSAATQFSWTAVHPSCVYRVQLASPTDDSSQIVLYTTATSASIPADAGLTDAASYTWSVTCQGQRAQTASLDDIVKIGGASIANYSSGAARPFVAQ